eukprot:3443272-Pyramimonas_sp.AAC.1
MSYGLTSPSVPFLLFVVTPSSCNRLGASWPREAVSELGWPRGSPTAGIASVRTSLYHDHVMLAAATSSSSSSVLQILHGPSRPSVRLSLSLASRSWPSALVGGAVGPRSGQSISSSSSSSSSSSPPFSSGRPLGRFPRASREESDLAAIEGEVDHEGGLDGDTWESNLHRSVAGSKARGSASSARSRGAPPARARSRSPRRAPSPAGAFGDAIPSHLPLLPPN